MIISKCVIISSMRRISVLIILLIIFYSVEAQRPQKQELLINAILSHNVDSVKLLLTQGANPNYENIYGITPLLFAVEQGDTAIIKILLDSGAKINIVPPYDPPAISFAVINFKDTVLRFLLEHNANPDIFDHAGRSPLYYAIVYGNYGAADLLLLYGADPDRLVNGWTPLQLATYYNDTLLINMLVYYGADVNKADTLGITPLHVAAQYNNLLAAKDLVGHQARLDLLTNDLASPIDFAIYSRSHVVFDFLIGQNPSFDNFVNGRYDAYQVAEYTQNYHARRTLAKNGMRTPSFVLEYYVRFTQFFNFGSYMPGMDIGVKELYSNVSLSFGFYKSLFNRRILIPQNEHVFYQYWESRWVIDLMVKRDFYLFHMGRINNYLSIGANFLMSYAAYRGTLMTDMSRRIAPAIGLSFDYNRFGMEALVTYLDMPLLSKTEFFGNIGLYYRLPTTQLRISTKGKILY